MKLLRFGPQGHERPGLLGPGNQILDLSQHVRDFDESFWRNGGWDLLRPLLSDPAALPVIPEGTRLGPPVARPSKLICIGLNYADHARESGAKPPQEPVVFFKSTTAICGPFDEVLLPPGSVKTDWEVELAFVIGKEARRVPLEEALQYIGGYLLHNDVSEREYQLERGGQWVKGKSFDTFAPLGPWLVSPDEIADPGQLDLWLELNGKRVQQSNTRELIFSIPFLVSYLSHHMTLLPGDVVTTGTPAGVGLGMNPPTYLRHGDVMRLSVEGLGESEQWVGQAV